MSTFFKGESVSQKAMVGKLQYAASLEGWMSVLGSVMIKSLGSSYLSVIWLVKVPGVCLPGRVLLPVLELENSALSVARQHSNVLRVLDRANHPRGHLASQAPCTQLPLQSDRVAVLRASGKTQCQPPETVPCSLFVFARRARLLPSNSGRRCPGGAAAARAFELGQDFRSKFACKGGISGLGFRNISNLKCTPVGEM